MFRNVADVDCSFQKHCQKAHETARFEVCNRRNNINCPSLKDFIIILFVGVLRLHNLEKKLQKLSSSKILNYLKMSVEKIQQPTVLKTSWFCRYSKSHNQ